MTNDEKTGENAEQSIDEANAGTLEEPREDDEGGDETLDSVPDA
jgi:hypothetical protein